MTTVHLYSFPGRIVVTIPRDRSTCYVKSDSAAWPLSRVHCAKVLRAIRRTMRARSGERS